MTSRIGLLIKTFFLKKDIALSRSIELNSGVLTCNETTISGLYFLFKRCLTACFITSCFSTVSSDNFLGLLIKKILFSLHFYLIILLSDETTTKGLYFDFNAS